MSNYSRKKSFWTLMGAMILVVAGIFTASSALTMSSLSATAATALFTLALHSSIFSESSYIVRKKSIKSLSKFIFIPTIFLYSMITFRKTFSKIPALTLFHFTTFYKKSQASIAKRRPFLTAFYRLSIYSCSRLQTPLQGNLQAHFRASPALSPQGLLA